MSTANEDSGERCAANLPGFLETAPSHERRLFREISTDCIGRQSTDAILRPPAASRSRVAVGQVRKLTFPEEWVLTADRTNSTLALEKNRHCPPLAVVSNSPPG